LSIEVLSNKNPPFIVFLALHALTICFIEHRQFST